jgi:hypothetical protein
MLVKYVDTPDDGEPIFAFGRHPVGFFIFTAGGHVAFSIMRNPPDIAKPTSDPDPDACIPGWYCAYFGTYDDGGDLTFLVLIRRDRPTYRQFTSIVGKEASLADEPGEAMMMNFCARCSRKA